ncbi:hypothetical protein B0A48_06810 [Cryoendolithus antarcticus]|uniref:ubiquitinyl hydrolase 1 n=1 Tax=Cryoendolithus antarcticus TaxID=1507870 RepID=A0A1V8T9D2_9PEZI|nr:hypothetical protein B0A48_06810 [Cryoendolithus antarcticus]
MDISQPTGPGKLAPRLLHDFLSFDPQKNSATGNILTDLPPPFGDAPPPTPHRDACKHDYCTKLEQSVQPPLDLRADGTTEYKLALVCKRCRIHADFFVSFGGASDPCPNSKKPLHHFRSVRELHTVDAHKIGFVWVCSSESCRASLKLVYKLPKISKPNVLLLTDSGRLRQRYEEIIADDPGREGVRQATPVEPLARLRRYLKDALNPEHERRSFPANNKRFVEAFGVQGKDCAELLQELGFQYDHNEGTWALPNPPVVDDRLHSDTSSAREDLEDVQYELLALMATVAAQNNCVNPSASEGWPSATRDIERVLASQGYPRLVSLRRSASGGDHNPYISSLGAVTDFGDSLIEFAYDRQVACDPMNEAYYLECLQEITKQRGSEDLQVKMFTQESAGLVSRRDLREAYRTFGLPTNGGGADDERILNLFHAQHTDLGAQGQENLREMLGRIGRARGSSTLNNASRQSVETIEEAYAWLGNGLGPQSDDSMVTTIYAVKTDGNKDLEEIGRRAISTIAKERKSDFLNTFLLGGDPNEASMNVDEALRLLNVEERLEAVDPTIWPTVFESARADRAGSETERAIAAVQQALRGGKPGDDGSPAPETWPVGLISHGNTCYLNSLLQYYFSLKPLRNIVLEYEKFQLDTSKTTKKAERVGQLMVTLQEIKGGQKFAEELRHLFERMIKEPGSKVKPEQDLVCRAFLAPSDFALLGEKLVEDENAIDENAIEDSDTIPPLVNGSTLPVELPGTVLSSASSATLQASEDGDLIDTPMKDPPVNGAEMPLTPPTSPKVAPDAPPPLPPRRHSTTTSDTLRLAEEKARQQQDVTEVHDSVTQRLRAGMQAHGTDDRGEQMDPLRDLFAIGLSQTTLAPADGKSRTEKIADSSILLEVPREPTDLYAALDDYFDPASVSESSETQQYKTITSLPPLVQISMPRIYFDEATKKGMKSDVSVRLEDELYLDRYYDSAHPDIVHERRKTAWGWRKRIRELKAERKAFMCQSDDLAGSLEGPHAVAEAAKYISSLDDINKDLLEIGELPIDTASEVHVALTADAALQSERLAAIDSEVLSLTGQLDALFSDLKRHKYRLTACFKHRGGSSGGHYWVSIHDFKTGIWRNYNDETVKEVPSSQLHEIFEAKEYMHGTPTYAVYVRDEDKDNIVDAVCRNPEKTASVREPSPRIEATEISAGWQDIDTKMDGPGETTVNPRTLENGVDFVADNRKPPEDASAIKW